MNSAWCDGACVDCDAPVDSNYAALCMACTSLHLMKQPIASSSRLAPSEPTVHEDVVIADPELEPLVPMSFEALHRTKSQSIRAWVTDLTTDAPSRVASFESLSAPRTPSPRRMTIPGDLTTPRARRSLRPFARPSLLRPSASAASLRVCRESCPASRLVASPLECAAPAPAHQHSSHDSTPITSPTIPTPAPPPADLPICAVGSSVASSVMRSIRTWMPVTPTPAAEPTWRIVPADSIATLVDLAVPSDKHAIFDDLDDEDDASSTTSCSSAHSSAAELPHAELGRRVALKASRHRASHLRLDAVVPASVSFTGSRPRLAHCAITA